MLFDKSPIATKARLAAISASAAIELLVLYFCPGPLAKRAGAGEEEIKTAVSNCS